MSETTIRDMLNRLVDLATEAFVTWDAPNPGDRSERGQRQVHAPAPTNLSALVALRPDHGMLPLITECVRIIWEQMPTDQRPELHHPPTWAGEVGWLLATFEWWQANLDQFDLGWVEDTISQTYTELERITRQPQARPVKCGRCEAGTLDQVRADMWECYACGHVVTVRAVTLKEASKETGVPLRTLQDWANRPGLLRPILDGGPRKRLFDLGDVRRVVAEMRLRSGA